MSDQNKPGGDDKKASPEEVRRLDPRNTFINLETARELLRDFVHSQPPPVCNPDSNDDLIMYLSSLEKRPHGNYFAPLAKSQAGTWVTIDGWRIKALVDTGSECSLISTRCAKFFHNSLKPCNINLKRFSPEPLISVQSLTAKLGINGIEIDVTFLVVPDDNLDFDVYIGRNIFVEDHNLVAVSSLAGTTVIRRPPINQVHTPANMTDFDAYLHGADKDHLLKVLLHYHDMSTADKS